MPSELARFLPRIARASEESLPSIGEKPQEYEAVVAFLDIQSSVTISLALERSSEDSSSKVSRALQERTRPGNGEAIRKALNTFFESSISIIEMYGGDVLKVRHPQRLITPSSLREFDRIHTGLLTLSSVLTGSAVRRRCNDRGISAHPGGNNLGRWTWA